MATVSITWVGRQLVSVMCESIMWHDRLYPIMSETAWDDTKTEEEVQENIDQAVEDVKDLDFATLDEVKEAFQQ